MSRTLPIQARRTANRIGEALEVWQKHVEKMPWLEREGRQVHFRRVGGRRHRQIGGSYQPRGMLTPLCYALLLNEVFRHSDLIAATCATGSLGTVLVDSTGEGTGYSVEELVLKIMATHFADALPLQVSGNSPQQAVPGTPWVDFPKISIGSPTYPLDVVAALSSDRKRLILPWLIPPRRHSRFRLESAGSSYVGPASCGRLQEVALMRRISRGKSRCRDPLKSPQSALADPAQSALADPAQVPPLRVNVYEIEIENA